MFQTDLKIEMLSKDLCWLFGFPVRESLYRVVLMIYPCSFENLVQNYAGGRWG